MIREIDEASGEVVETMERKLDEWPKIVQGLEPLKELDLRGKLALKLSKAYRAVAAVVHDDTNTEHKYSFASAEVIYKVCREGMAEVGLAILPFMGDYLEAPILKKDNSGERRGAYLQVNFDYVLMDSETGYGIVIPWVGEVMEYGDKAFNKASTNATKYMLRTLFLLPTDKDEDPDRGAEQGRPSNTQARSQGQGRQQQGQDRRQAPPATQPKPPEQDDRTKRAGEVFAIAYPFFKVDGHALQAEQKAAYKEFKAVCEANGYITTDVLLYASGKGDVSHSSLLTFAKLPALAGVPKKPAPAVAPGAPAVAATEKTGEASKGAKKPEEGDPKSTGAILADGLRKEFDRSASKLETLKVLDSKKLGVDEWLAEAAAKGATCLVDALAILDGMGGA